MNTTTKNATTAVLFDFDGVIMDTEGQYSIFWDKMGATYLGTTDLGPRIKGQTLKYIFDTFFEGKVEIQAQITAALDRFEQEMAYNYIPGVLDFITDLRSHDVRMAVVTSSNRVKMEAVYRAHPEVKSLFDRILTAEMFTRSKPAPDCFLLGMEILGSTPHTTYVFEDSFNGLKSGMASQATVIGLATTNAAQDIAPLCHAVLDDFTAFTYDKLMQLHK